MASSGEDDDNDDIEALRKAALATLKPKIQTIIGSVSGVSRSQVPEWSEVPASLDYPGFADPIPEPSLFPVPQDVPVPPDAPVPLVLPNPPANLTHPSPSMWRPRFVNRMPDNRFRFHGFHAERRPFHHPRALHRSFGDRGRPLFDRGRRQRRGYITDRGGFSLTNINRDMPKGNPQGPPSASIVLHSPSVDPAVPVGGNLIVIQPHQATATDDSSSHIAQRLDTHNVNNAGHESRTSSTNSISAKIETSTPSDISQKSKLLLPQDRYHSTPSQSPKRDEDLNTELEQSEKKSKDKFSRYDKSDSEDEDDWMDDRSEVDDIAQEIDKFLADVDEDDATEEKDSITENYIQPEELVRRAETDSEDNEDEENGSHQSSPEHSEGESLDLDALANGDPVIGDLDDLDYLVEEEPVVENGSDTVKLLTSDVTTSDGALVSDKVVDKERKSASLSSSSYPSSVSERSPKGCRVIKNNEDHNLYDSVKAMKSSDSITQHSKNTADDKSQFLSHKKSKSPLSEASPVKDYVDKSKSNRSPYHMSHSPPSKTRSPLPSNIRSRSRSPLHQRTISRSRSPVHQRTRSRSRSPVHQRIRSRSRSPLHQRTISRSRSPVHQRIRSRSRSPVRQRPQSRSRSPIRARSPKRFSPKRRSVSPRRSPVPQRRSPLRGRSPRRKSFSPARRSPNRSSSPRRITSPLRPNTSTQRRPPFSGRSISPRGRRQSPQRRSASPHTYRANRYRNDSTNRNFQGSRKEGQTGTGGRTVECNTSPSSRSNERGRWHQSEGRRSPNHRERQGLDQPKTQSREASSGSKIHEREDPSKDLFMDEAELAKLPPEERAKIEARRKKFGNKEEIKLEDAKKTVSLKSIKERKKKAKKTEKSTDSVDSTSNKTLPKKSEKSGISLKALRKKVEQKKTKEESEDEEVAKATLHDLEDESEDSDSGRAWRLEENKSKPMKSVKLNSGKLNYRFDQTRELRTKFDKAENRTRDYRSSLPKGRMSRSHIDFRSRDNVPNVDNSDENIPSKRLGSSVVASRHFRADIPPEKLRVQIQVSSKDKKKKKTKARPDLTHVYAVPAKRGFDDNGDDDDDDEKEEEDIPAPKKKVKKKDKKEKKKKMPKDDSEDDEISQNENPVEQSRPSILERLGKKVELGAKEKKKKKKKSKHLDNAEEVDDLDTHIRKMKLKNAAIERRQREIQLDKERYG